MSGCTFLPKKLGATVQEYLRQRESGVITLRSAIAFQVAQLLRAAALCAGDAPDIVVKTREALLEHDRSELLIRALSERVLEILHHNTPNARSALLAAFVQEVREAENELGEQLSAALAGQCVLFAPVARSDVLPDAAALALERAQTIPGVLMPAPRIVVAAPPTKDAELLGERMATAGVAAKSFLDYQAMTALRGAGKVVIVAHAMHCKFGCAADSGARVVAKAARRAGVAVVVALPRYSVLKGDPGCGMRRVRAHPGAVWEYADVRSGKGVEVMVREFDWVPLSEVDVVVTEFGGYAPEYLMRTC